MVFPQWKSMRTLWLPYDMHADTNTQSQPPHPHGRNLRAQQERFVIWIGR